MSGPASADAVWRGLRVVCVGEFALGSRRAHAINVVKTAGGFARLGCEVTLLCAGPGSSPDSAEAAGCETRDTLAALGEPGLRVETIAGVNDRTHPPGSDARGETVGAWAVERAAALDAQVMYARQLHAPIWWADRGGTAIVETHAHVGNAKASFQRVLDATVRATRPIAVISTISERLRAHYVERGAASGRVHVVPDGVDVDLFARPDDPGRMPSDPCPARHPRAVYAGHLYDWKGIPAILDAAARLPRVWFDIYGGTEGDIARHRETVAARGLANVALRGWIEHAALPGHLSHADALLLPPGLGDPSKDWTSPVKLGEYLAAGAPIVASAIPALRDWVDERVVQWFEPDDGAGMARAIEAALGESSDGAAARRVRALELARAWSYPARARRMLGAALGSGPAPALRRGLEELPLLR
ncbi:MAG: glycosyltransferase [Phycisphaerales bacterium]